MCENFTFVRGKRGLEQNENWINEIPSFKPFAILSEGRVNICFAGSMQSRLSKARAFSNIKFIVYFL